MNINSVAPVLFIYLSDFFLYFFILLGQSYDDIYKIKADVVQGVHVYVCVCVCEICPHTVSPGMRVLRTITIIYPSHISQNDITFDTLSEYF